MEIYCTINRIGEKRISTMKGDSPTSSCWDSVGRITKINSLKQTHPLFSEDRPYAEDGPPE